MRRRWRGVSGVKVVAKRVCQERLFDLLILVAVGIVGRLVMVVNVLGISVCIFTVLRI